MKVVLVIAPHPDDETLGCGGALLRHIESGDQVHWLIVTEISADIGFSAQKVKDRGHEIELVANMYGFMGVHKLGFKTMRLDQVGMLDIVSGIGHVVHTVKPDILYIPYRNDAHSDHQIVFDASASCAKTFRYPYVKSVLSYETLSETEFGMRPEDGGFRPNLFINIEGHLERKIKILEVYEGEMAEHPFPRSRSGIEALATLRGSQSGLVAAEAFMILKEVR